jgi:TetR/AcrR family transcriptional regulator, transcriptional repressor for nem operon
MTSPDMHDRILDAAEARARVAGYHGFSFREIAADVAIKSASVHYYFPTKADLSLALVQRYKDRIMARLGDPADLTATEAKTRVVAVFRDAMFQDNKMCLCGLFGASADGLPDGVTQGTAAFFRAILSYLETAMGTEGQGEAAALLARLEGALILARTMKAPEMFDAIVASNATTRR